MIILRRATERIRMIDSMRSVAQDAAEGNICFPEHKCSADKAGCLSAQKTGGSCQAITNVPSDKSTNCKRKSVSISFRMLPIGSGKPVEYGHVPIRCTINKVLCLSFHCGGIFAPWLAHRRNVSRKYRNLSTVCSRAAIPSISRKPVRYPY